MNTRQKLFELVQRFTRFEFDSPDDLRLEDSEIDHYMACLLYDIISPLARKKLRKAFFEQGGEIFIKDFPTRKNELPEAPYEICSALFELPVDLRESEKFIYLLLDEKKVWLDDERPAPEGWYHVKTAAEAIEALERGPVSEISLDNDLGLDDEEGYDVMKFLEEKAFSDKSFHIPVIHIHTANPVARQKMQAGIENIRKFRS